MSTATAHLRDTVVRTELARYRVVSEDRILIATGVNGVLTVTDAPVTRAGLAYVVEPSLSQANPGALTALVADYLRQAQRLNMVPMRYLPIEPEPSID